jgi:hypothetical protein
MEKPSNIVKSLVVGAIVIMLCLPQSAFAGLKVGLFLPHNKNFPNSTAYGIDGYGSVYGNLQLGFDFAFISNITGEKYSYAKGNIYDSHPVKTDLSLLNIFVNVRYMLFDCVYVGGGAGGFVTTPTKEGNIMGGDVSEPQGFAYQAIAGIKMRSSERWRHFLPYLEARYLHQDEEGTLETLDQTEIKISDFSGMLISVGVTF